MNRLQNEMRLQAQRAMSEMATVRFGLVDAYDPGAYAVKVRYQPDDTISGWLPIKSLWAGNNCGFQVGPEIGMEAVVLFQEGEHEAGLVVAFGFNDVERPLPVPSGEAWLTHKSGSLIKFHNDGTVEMQATAFNMTGDVNLTGTLTATGDVKAGSISLKTHKHGGVSPGGGTTGTPQ